MAEATSNWTRELIKRATARGRLTDAFALAFAERAAQAKAAFDAEVDPLHLSDMAYERELTDSGLRVMTNLAQTIERRMLAVQTERAA